MSEWVPWILWGWVLVTLVLFLKWPGRDSALVSLIAGWAILPVMSYPESAFLDQVGGAGTAQGVTIYSGIFLNKATAIGLGCLAGMVAFDWAMLRRVRWGKLDLSMAVWCLVPLASAVSNGLGIAEGLTQVRHQALTWGVPYLIGRAYLGDSQSLGRLEQGIVLVGLVSVPLVLLEFLLGPFVYEIAYGRHPYLTEGAARPLFWRPLLFQEHGNQFGLMIVCSAVAAVWLWRAGRLPLHDGLKPASRSPGGVAAGLSVVALACQSHGAIALGVAAMAPALFFKPRRAPGGRSRGRSTAWALGLLLALGLGVGLFGLLASRDAGIRQRIRSTFIGLGKTSFTWRLARSEEILRDVAKRPVLGWGDLEWAEGSTGAKPLNPVNMSFGLLSIGRYGVVGLLAWGGALLGPVVLALRRLSVEAWLSRSGSTVALAAVLVLLGLGDSLFNSVWIVPLTAAAGGLASWVVRKPAGPGLGRS